MAELLVGLEPHAFVSQLHCFVERGVIDIEKFQGDIVEVRHGEHRAYDATGGITPVR